MTTSTSSSSPGAMAEPGAPAFGASVPVIGVLPSRPLLASLLTALGLAAPPFAGDIPFGGVIVSSAAPLPDGAPSSPGAALPESSDPQALNKPNPAISAALELCMKSGKGRLMTSPRFLRRTASYRRMDVNARDPARREASWLEGSDGGCLRMLAGSWGNLRRMRSMRSRQARILFSSSSAKCLPLSCY
jgi:hypothetical protein